MLSGEAPSVNPYVLPALTGQHVDHLHDASHMGGYHIIHHYTIAAGVAADHDFDIDYKTTFTRFQVILLGAGVVGSTIQVQNAGDAISEEMDTSGAAHVVVHSGIIDNDHMTILSGGTLRLACGGGGGCPDIMVIAAGFRAV